RAARCSASALSIPRTFSHPVIYFRFQNIMKLFVFKCRDNDHKNDNMKINPGMKGKKKRPPGGSRNKVRVVLCRMWR
ncbi:hypothetical protein, partial [Escherichia coli]|uniref:hypothetical protein n=1 Tax=Escherichia coli TaxID=562 RepID=UPI00207BE7FF